MKIGQYCQRQRCRHAELKQFRQAFASRGFVSDSWAFLFIIEHHCSCSRAVLFYFYNDIEQQAEWVIVRIDQSINPSTKQWTNQSVVKLEWFSGSCCWWYIQWYIRGRQLHGGSVRCTCTTSHTLVLVRSLTSTSSVESTLLIRWTRQRGLRCSWCLILGWVQSKGPSRQRHWMSSSARMISAAASEPRSGSSVHYWRYTTAVFM